MSNAPWIWWRGRRVTLAGRDSIIAAEGRAGFRFTLTQGGFNRGAVAASAGTHDGEAIDCSVRGLSRAQVELMIEALRWAGWAAWLRTTSAAKWGVRAHGFGAYHVHAVPNGWGLPSAGAEAQAVAYRRGRDGLKGNGIDAGGPGHVSTWTGQRSPRRPGLPATGDKAPTPKDTRTPIERMLADMDIDDLRKLIYQESHVATRNALSEQWDKSRGDEWGASPRDSIARGAYRSGAALTTATQILGIVQRLAEQSGIVVDTAEIVAELTDALKPAIREALAAEVGDDIADRVVAAIGTRLVEG